MACAEPRTGGMAEGPDVASRHRAKVYCLNDDGQWDDRGTGHAAVTYVQVTARASLRCPGLALRAVS